MQKHNRIITYVAAIGKRRLLEYKNKNPIIPASRISGSFLYISIVF